MVKSESFVGKPMATLIKASMASRWRMNFQEHPATREIVRRTPEDLKPFLYQVLVVEENPLGLLCGPRDTNDEGYFAIWADKWLRNYADPEHDDGFAGAPEPSPS